MGFVPAQAEHAGANKGGSAPRHAVPILLALGSDWRRAANGGTTQIIKLLTDGENSCPLTSEGVTPPSAIWFWYPPPPLS